MKRLALLLCALVLLLAACGGGGGSGGTSDVKAQVTSAYEKFFAPKTSLSDRVALLQDGAKFKSLIQGFASNPLAKNVSVAVNSVTPQGASKAKVVYVIKINGQSPLGTQIGYAVKQNGRWEIDSQSLCSLLELGGSAPPQCKT